MADPISALITGGLGILGGLFGRKKNQTQVVENRVDYQRLVADAEAAGFNPLTALRNGGAAGYSVSTQSHPGLSGSEMIGQAFQTAGNVFQAYQDDKVADEQRSTEKQLIEAQLKNIVAGTQLKMRSLDVPTGSGGGYRRGGGEMSIPGPLTPEQLQAFGVAVNDPNRPFEMGNLTTTNPARRDNTFWKVDPNQSDAEAFETRYGDSEIMSMANGALTWGGDLLYSTNEWMKRYSGAAPRIPGIPSYPWERAPKIKTGGGF